MRVPVLETERLRLRAHTLADFDSVAAMWADPAVVRHIGGKPATIEESWARLLRYPGHWELLGYGFWAIEEKETGAFVGEAGFADFKRAIEPPFDAPEQGWTLLPSAQGRGLMSEAMTAMLAWGEAHFARSDFVCMIAPENAASIRIAEKAGYREYARTTYKGSDTALFRRAAGLEKR